MSIKSCSITELTDFKFGHAQDFQAATGVTVITTTEGQGVTAGVDVRGSAPGTRETDLLDPTNLVEEVHGIFLAGGSAFGLEAAGGIMKYLEESGVGVPTGYAKVPIVPGAILFDLGIGDPRTRPDANMGYQAAKNAANSNPQEGNYGCGTGATIGKFAGEAHAMKAGVGVSAFRTGDLIVASLVAVNCFGEVIDPETGQIIGGAYDSSTYQFIRAREVLGHDSESDKENSNSADNGKDQGNSHGDSERDSGGYNDDNDDGERSIFSRNNTTIGVVVTNAQLTKAAATKVSQMAHSGISRTTRPAHSMLDGDALFTMASGRVTSDLTLIGELAALSVEKSIINGVTKAQSSHNLPAHNDIFF
ncbi:P1 family peptidase [Natranaerobius thermophilus]|uniref:Peptidase S58 DmpA n=1 Tax=Natranaerobius thermophilus (strain ATCC BAA-1301 / DSM 18059 / JW/NM-WN-LF) TaxID=457570 RepID=B2A815_NATTJ|nr:P1 family peptidase [Natranaerobius thermophilus]ACB85787.1 peptidase S58 DmpA [Natranaerobius thermophilus JW/NM-WN-LF]